VLLCGKKRSLPGLSSGSGCNGRNPCCSTLTKISSAEAPCDFDSGLLRRLPALDLLLYQHASLSTPHDMIEQIIHIWSKQVKIF
jgi:hypothetical protein